MPDLLLAIDLGSSWCKAAYLDPAGNFIAEGRSYTRDIVPSRTVMLEQYWNAVVAAVRDANRRLTDSPHPVAIAHSTRAQFGICLDHLGRPFCPAYDALISRASPELQQVYAPEAWGNKDPFAVGYGTRLAATALWIKRHRPEEWLHIARIGSLHDYIVYRLTGEWVTDPTSGPGPLGWPRELTNITGLPQTAFPTTLEPQTVVGGLMEETAAALELPTGTPVAVGLHDGAAANLGVRAIQAGDACLTLGTNFVFRAATGPRLATGCFQYLVAPGSWAWVNNVPIASTQLDIVAETLIAQPSTMSDRHRSLGALAGLAEPGAQGLEISRIVPHAENSLRHNVRAAQQAGYDNGVIYRAIMESIAYGVRDLVAAAMRCGVVPKRYVATGGSAHNYAFLSVLSSVLDTPIEIGPPEAGLIGAGIVAALASHMYSTFEEAIHAMTSTYSAIQPDRDAVRFYRSVANVSQP